MPTDTSEQLIARAEAALARAPRQPDAHAHNPSPEYLRGLVLLIGLPPREIAEKLGITKRTLNYYLCADRPAPYSVQYALETLARSQLRYRNTVRHAA